NFLTNKNMSKKYIFAIVLILVFIAVGYFIVRSKQEVNERVQSSIAQSINEIGSNRVSQPQFLGEEGEAVDLVDGQVSIIANVFDNNLAHYYHTELPDGKIVHFFVIKDKNGVYRAAANTCQVCFGARMGFRQEGDFMVCNACGNKYPLEKIATEKGGCNPGPINPNLKDKDGKIIIEQSDLEQVAEFF
ncbi:MAG: DUF2318 domain-containing protein, partial [Candidatus Nealsonbacteria bacterium]